MPGGRPTVQLIVAMAALACCAGAASADWADCPSPCQCKWSSGKKTALCRDADLERVPDSLDSDMQVLDLGGNNLRRLPEEAFKRAGLLNLQRAFLRGCGVSDVHRDAFAELKILVEVDLSDNLIGALHRDTFRGNDRLRVLYLNGNPLTEIAEAQFPALPHLRTLELQHCRIERVHRDAFIRLPALESLNLNGNVLRWLSETVFLPVGKLNTLSLDGNPWTCDCRLRSFRDWFVGSNLYARPLSCVEPPQLSGARWENLKPAEFACAPQVRIDRADDDDGGGGGARLEDAGNNVTFACEATGDPEPAVSWYFNGRAVIADDGRNGTDRYRGRMDVNGSRSDDGRVLSSLSVYNVSDAVAGEFTCEARNSRGRASANASLALPEVAVATTLSESESAYVVAACAAVAGVVALLAVAVACCACRSRASAAASAAVNGRRDAKASAFRGSSSFCSDADKRLLDASVSTCTPQPGSCEMLHDGDHLELVEHGLRDHMELAVAAAAACDRQQLQPVHITIESRDPTSADHCGGGGGGGGVSVYPPPPEFSTTGGGYGNIFISVSVGHEPPSAAVAIESADSECRYPDLLDMKHRQNRGGVHRHHRGVDGGAHHRVPAVAAAAASYYATMPRKTNRLPKDHRPAEPLPPPHYDNMGPRITAAGSCTNLSSLCDSDRIPPPPPPPLCTGRSDYVAL